MFNIGSAYPSSSYSEHQSTNRDDFRRNRPFCFVSYYRWGFHDDSLSKDTFESARQEWFGVRGVHDLHDTFLFSGRE